MIDLKDVTFTIPVRLDSPERKRNIDIVVDYINTYFQTTIIIGEESASPELQYLSNSCKYIHYQTYDPSMRRTWVLNTLAREAKTPIIVNYDTDVIFPIDQYIKSVDLIRSGMDMVYPYDGRFLNITDESDINSLRQTKDLTNINPRLVTVIRTDSCGGAVFWNKEKFIEGGMENENFVSWGFEDDERLYRFKTLGYKIARVDGALFHINHPPSPNSATQHKFYDNNQYEFNAIRKLNAEQIRLHMEDWAWLT